MKYPNIKAAHLSHAQIAKAFGYANVKSFRTSSAHQRHMRGVEVIVESVTCPRQMTKLDYKELDELITYMETDLIPDNPNKELIHDGICRYAELWHSKQTKFKPL
jgi:hypothetical protein